MRRHQRNFHKIDPLPLQHGVPIVRHQFPIRSPTIDPKRSLDAQYVVDGRRLWPCGFKGYVNNIITL